MSDDWRHEAAQQLSDRNDYVVVLKPYEPVDTTEEQLPSNAIGVITSSYGTGSTLIVEVGADDNGAAFATVRSFDDDGNPTPTNLIDSGDSIMIIA